MVVTDSYTAGNNQLRDSTITPQLELARTYYNENIFTRVIEYRESFGLISGVEVCRVTIS